MNRQRIVAEIQRIALENGGHGPGRQAFARATGVKRAEWYPDIWLRWGDALGDAGYAPNLLQTKASDELLLEKYIGFARHLGRFPVEGELRRKAREDQSFPSHSVFSRFGGKDKLLEAVATHCRKTSGFEDVLALFAERETKSVHPKAANREHERKIATEFVYLMKSGPHYKIGRTNSLGRRGSELTIKIPVPPKTIHSIETDDPIGVESYWHRRFANKRGEGEWFELSPEDVNAFKRWRRIV
jgi:hypothetical protein